MAEIRKYTPQCSNEPSVEVLNPSTSAEINPKILTERAQAIGGILDCYAEQSKINKRIFVANKPMVGPPPPEKEYVYGTLAPDSNTLKGYARKTLYYPALDKNSVPDWYIYDPAFTQTTLPGFVAFSPEDFRQASQHFLDRSIVPRAKLAIGASNEGQYELAEVATMEHLERRILTPDDYTNGIIIEPNLYGITALSMAETTLPDGTQHLTVGYQFFWPTNSSKPGEYGGTVVIPMNFIERNMPETRRLELLIRLPSPFGPQHAQFDYELIQKLRRHIQILREVEREYGIYSTRRNVDGIIGVNSLGEQMIGIGDHSPRPGGASMPELLTITSIIPKRSDTLWTSMHIFSPQELDAAYNFADEMNTQLIEVAGGRITDWPGIDYAKIIVLEVPFEKLR